jgi:hypothetical protein
MGFFNLFKSKTSEEIAEQSAINNVLEIKSDLVNLERKLIRSMAESVFVSKKTEEFITVFNAINEKRNQLNLIKTSKQIKKTTIMQLLDELLA